jgi:acetate kinase
MKYFIVNPGSASKKYALFEGSTELFRAHLEHDEDSFVANITVGEHRGKIVITASDFKSPYKHIFDLLLSYGLIDSKDAIEAVGIRIVAPGKYFTEHKTLSGKYFKKLKEAEELAPLHVGPVLQELVAVQKHLPDARLFGISDSAFHSERPDVSKYYGIKRTDAEKFQIYRYSYHGLSVDSILDSVREELGVLPERVIVCHLGGGASVTAVKNGKSFDSSMGFSPLEGLIMATRVGDIDAGALIYLAKKLGMSFGELEDYLNHKCGLKGISGSSSDIRELIKQEEGGFWHAKQALDTYVYKIKKYIGSYIAAMNGVDLLIFSGTVGERSSIIRERVCMDLGWLGIEMNASLNSKESTKNRFLHSGTSRVRVGVFKTEEVEEIARQMRKLLK